VGWERRSHTSFFSTTPLETSDVTTGPGSKLTLILKRTELKQLSFIFSAHIKNPNTMLVQVNKVEAVKIQKHCHMATVSHSRNEVLGMLKFQPR